MKCPTCNGCSKVDSEEGLPWNRYLEPGDEKVTVVENGKERERGAYPHETKFFKAIQAGEVFPVNCPDCKGSGQVADKPSDSPKPNEKSKV